eukprot:141739-Pyramimonas_sp.AAC.1
MSLSLHDVVLSGSFGRLPLPPVFPRGWVAGDIAKGHQELTACQWEGQYQQVAAWAKKLLAGSSRPAEFQIVLHSFVLAS